MPSLLEAVETIPFWKLVDETQMSNPCDHAARHILSKFSFPLPLRGVYFRSYLYETPCTWRLGPVICSLICALMAFDIHDWINLGIFQSLTIDFGILHKICYDFFIISFSAAKLRKQNPLAYNKLVYPPVGLCLASHFRRACGHVDVGTCPHQVFAATLTLFQPGGADYAHHILVSTPSFESHRRACIDILCDIVQHLLCYKPTHFFIQGKSNVEYFN